MSTNLFPWLIPSFYGDVRLEAMDSRRCRVIVTKATVAEQKAIEALQSMALKKGWLSKLPASLSSVEYDAPIQKIAKVLSSALKPGRALVSAIRFASGKIEEVTESTFADDGTIHQAVEKKEEKKDGPYRTPVIPIESARKPEVAKVPDPPAAAVTVAQPVRGCPPPDFPSAELKARAVLSMFLDDQQRADFARYNRFVSIGGTTGHKYMVTSRHARDQLAMYQRTLFDIDDNMPICTHDWDMPPAEECLALHVLVQLPGYESYLRYLES